MCGLGSLSNGMDPVALFIKVTNGCIGAGISSALCNLDKESNLWLDISFFIPSIYNLLSMLPNAPCTPLRLFLACSQLESVGSKVLRIYARMV